MKPIKQSVINTFGRVGIDYEHYGNDPKLKIAIANNWLTNEPCEVTPLIAVCINWVYQKQLAFERGNMGCRQDDFDRVRYFILEQDRNAYMICLD